MIQGVSRQCDCAEWICPCGPTLVLGRDAGTISTTPDIGDHSLGNPLATAHEKEGQPAVLLADVPITRPTSANRLGLSIVKEAISKNSMVRSRTTTPCLAEPEMGRKNQLVHPKRSLPLKTPKHENQLA